MDRLEEYKYFPRWRRWPMLLLGAGSAVYSVTVACRKSCLIPRSSLEEGLPDSYVINEKTCRATAALTWHPSKEIIEFHSFVLLDPATETNHGQKRGSPISPYIFWQKKKNILRNVLQPERVPFGLTELLPPGPGPPTDVIAVKRGTDSRISIFSNLRILRVFRVIFPI